MQERIDVLCVVPCRVKQCMCKTMERFLWIVMQVRFCAWKVFVTCWEIMPPLALALAAMKSTSCAQRIRAR